MVVTGHCFPRLPRRRALAFNQCVGTVCWCHSKVKEMQAMKVKKQKSPQKVHSWNNSQRCETQKERNNMVRLPLGTFNSTSTDPSRCAAKEKERSVWIWAKCLKWFIKRPQYVYWDIQPVAGTEYTWQWDYFPNPLNINWIYKYTIIWYFSCTETWQRRSSWHKRGSVLHLHIWFVEWEWESLVFFFVLFSSLLLISHFFRWYPEMPKQRKKMFKMHGGWEMTLEFVWYLFTVRMNVMFKQFKIMLRPLNLHQY